MVQIQVLDVLPRVRLSRVARMRLVAMVSAIAVLLAPSPALAFTPSAAAKPSATRLQPKTSDIHVAPAASKSGTVIALPAAVGGPRGGPRAEDPLSADQRAAIDALVKRRDAGKVFSREEQHLLRRYEKGRRLSRLDADTLISRVLYYTYIDAEPMESSSDLAAAKDLLERYRAHVARKGRTIEDERIAGVNAPETTGGPDAFGYTFIDSTEPGGPTFSYVDIVSSPNYIGTGDDSAFTINLGGPGFCFYTPEGSGPYTQLRVSTNGYISTDLSDSGGDLSNDCPIPATPSTGGGGRIYVDHDDLVTDVFHMYDAGLQANIVQWQGFHFGSQEGRGDGFPIDVQVLLFDNGNILMQYANDVEGGSGSTRGIQDADPPTTGLLHSCNTPGSVFGGLAILFQPPVPCGGGQACELTCPANVTVSNDANQCGAVVTYPAPTTTGDCGPVTCVPPSGSFFPVGTTTVNCAETFVDNRGGATCSFTVTVNDTQLPTLTCPANITTAGSGVNGCVVTAVVNFAAPTVADNCPGAGAVVCVPPSGSTFNEGTTTVTCTATDAAGNAGNCTFTVTVGGTGTFGACVIDDFSGDSWSIVTDPASPIYRYWRYRVAATGETFCGVAESLAIRPGRSLTAADTIDPRFHMNANLNYGANSGTVQVTDVLTGRQFRIRDRNLANTPACP